ncbi:uncharacterized protein SCHCODRAFT_02596771 [Schizophyllum commune H4-8]|nr:uncharacterized protein SCHCODRAFT_02596771 [Schizophyllum commune H4-8]KAI5898158.1 hypothetical protein SCHCODRAFT_02596771 [Schizophyllum commune H4-8]
MAREGYVWCTHCHQSLPRKREREHRRLNIQPYPPPQPSPSRRRRIIEIESEDEEFEDYEGDEGSDDEEDGHSTRARSDGGSAARASTPAYTECGAYSPSPAVDNDGPEASHDVDEELEALDVTWELHPLREGLAAAQEEIAVEEDRAQVEGWASTEGEELDVAAEAEDSDDEDDYFDWDAFKARAEATSAFDDLRANYERMAAQARTLDAYDRAICRAFSFKLQSQTSDRAFAQIPYAFPQQPELPSLHEIRRRVSMLAEFQPQTYDCCVNSCCCYVGPHAHLQSCPYCDEPRYRSNGKPRKRFTYIPVKPRLRAFVQNQRMAELMRYRGHEHPNAREAGKMTDVFDGRHYRMLRERHVKLRGREQEHKYFDDTRDVALGLSTDGFAPFKRRKHTAW